LGIGEFNTKEIKQQKLEEYFYDLNNSDENKETNKNKTVKNTSKQFRASVNIIDLLLTNKDFEYTREEFVNFFDASEDEENKLGVDAYKHALKFLETAKIITNTHNNKKSIFWSLNKSLQIYRPRTRLNRTLKARMIVSVLNPAINYDTYTMASTVFQSKIYELKQTSLYKSIKEKKEIEQITKVEEKPYLLEELEVIRNNPQMDSKQFMMLMFEKTQDMYYLPKDLQEIFLI